MYVKDMQLQRKIIVAETLLFIFFYIKPTKRSSFVHNCKTSRHSVSHLYIHLKFVVSYHNTEF